MDKIVQVELFVNRDTMKLQNDINQFARDKRITKETVIDLKFIPSDSTGSWSNYHRASLLYEITI